MDEGKVYGKGISFPPRIGPDGRVAWSAGARNIRESIRVLLLTEFEERVMLPDFGGGLRSFLFRPNTVATRQLIQERTMRSLLRWEPRIAVESVTVEPDADDPQASVMVIEFKLKATGVGERISLALQFTGA